MNRIIYIRNFERDRPPNEEYEIKIFGSVGLFAPLCDAFFGGLEDFP